MRVGVTGDGLAVAAEAVVFGIVDEASADGVEIDVRGDGFNGAAGGLDEEGFKALGPEGAVAAVAFVEPDRKALFDQLHELRDVAHERELTFAPSIAFGAAGTQLGFDDVKPGGLKLGGRWIETAVATEKFNVGNGRALGHHQQDVEMVREDGVGVDSNAAKLGHLPELFAKHLAGRLVEDTFAIHHAADAVIDRIARFNRDLDSGFTHTTQENRPAIISNLHSHFQPVPVTAFI